MVIGLCYRELGKYDDALNFLVQADGCDALKEDDREGLRIRIAFEQALTLLKMENYPVPARASTTPARRGAANSTGPSMAWACH